MEITDETIVKYKIKCMGSNGEVDIKELEYSFEFIESQNIDSRIFEDIEPGCDGNSICVVNGFCECESIYEDFEIISRKIILDKE